MFLIPVLHLSQFSKHEKYYSSLTKQILLDDNDLLFYDTYIDRKVKIKLEKI